MLYLLHGPDEYQRSQALLRMRAAIPADVADLNITYLDGRKLKLDALAAACEAFPFLADMRLVIVADALKQTKAGKEREDLRAYLERVPATCDLVFVESDEVDRRSILFTYLKKVGSVLEFTPLQGSELTRWVYEQAQGLGVVIEPAATQRLIEFVGGESRAIINELAKLASYVGRGGKIRVAEVELLVADGQEQNLFSFIDDLSARRLGAALRGARMLLEDGQAPTYILFMLARQIRILLGVRELAARRMRADEIAVELGQRPFVIKKAMEQVRGFDAATLDRLHDRLLELDLATKTGRIQADVALELFVSEACR
ncbi:DNA polymerase III, delta subunit [Oscillochloris trichoides DG-6]|uniref:DNA polymerase III subunit delta n=1 Tax=Oscillochloris trichoides DG-6 TaxID=765420 RepID=E1IB29_9CHLR|nr:DNA polymerase III subunit delta [Oscillochloris trichoides]EFO81600.1 DNA polymerase III, delta subunit [Oscillochloris trichoides DG-6]